MKMISSAYLLNRLSVFKREIRAAKYQEKTDVETKTK
jgi:hypothetical protein